VSDHFYGTGESFLYRFVPPSTPENEETPKSPSESQPTSPVKEEPPAPVVGKIEVFDWTGENIFFIKGNNESLAIGSGE